MKRRALVSVSDKTGVAELARGLDSLGFEILSTGGTARLLREAGVPVREVSEVTGFPEILGGRVKTLQPAIHAGILARRDVPEDIEALARLQFQTIDVVVVNLYPFVQTVTRPDCTLPEAIEEIDIGGPSLLRASAKNWRHVTVLCDPADYPGALESLGAGGPSDEERFILAAKAFGLTARYDGSIVGYLSSRQASGEVTGAFPRTLSMTFDQVFSLRYGENPHQQAAFYRVDGEKPSLADAAVLQGKELSYNNLLDLDAALGLSLELPDPAAVVIKHTNPCGVAMGETLVDAYRKARAVDAQSAFGGIVALTREVDGDTASALAETFLEAIVAPSFSPAAREVLASKKNLRLVGVGTDRGQTGPTLRRVQGGLLVQDPDRPAVADGPGKVVTRREPTAGERAALSLAWTVAKHVKSNAVVFSHADRLAAVGAGQMSRVDSVRIARSKGGDALQGSVLASDAFFPFADGLIEAVEAGATAVIQPGGSIRDSEVIAAADERDIAMIFTGTRHFRH